MHLSEERQDDGNGLASRATLQSQGQSEIHPLSKSETDDVILKSTTPWTMDDCRSSSERDDRHKTDSR